MQVKAYLADSLWGSYVMGNYQNAEELAEVDLLYDDVLRNGPDVIPSIKRKAHEHFIAKVCDDPSRYNECEDLYCKALEEFPGDLDFSYYYACLLNKMEKYGKAFEILTGLESALTDESVSKSKYSGSVIIDPLVIINQILLAAQGLGDVDSMVKYAAVLLAADKTQQNILCPFISTLFKHGVLEDEVLKLLGNIYNLNEPGDLLLIARAAKSCGSIKFATMIITIANELMAET